MWFVTGKNNSDLSQGSVKTVILTHHHLLRLVIADIQGHTLPQWSDVRTYPLWVLTSTERRGLEPHPGTHPGHQPDSLFVMTCPPQVGLQQAATPAQDLNPCRERDHPDCESMPLPLGHLSPKFLMQQWYLRVTCSQLKNHKFIVCCHLIFLSSSVTFCIIFRHMIMLKAPLSTSTMVPYVIQPVAHIGAGISVNCRILYDASKCLRLDITTQICQTWWLLPTVSNLPGEKHSGMCVTKNTAPTKSHNTMSTYIKIISQFPCIIQSCPT